MKNSFKDRLKTFVKGMWHIAAVILLLSLPTFSFFMPGFELSDLVDLAVPGGYGASSGEKGSFSASASDSGAGSNTDQSVGFTRSVNRSSGSAGSAIRRSGRSGSPSAADRRTRPDRRGIISREGLDSSGRDSGGPAEPGDEDQVSADLLEAVLSDLESLDEVVKNLSSSYRSQGYSGSGAGRSINPFLRTLANSTDAGDSGGDSGGDTGGGDSGGDTSGGDTGSGDTGGGSSGDDDQNVDPEDRYYDSLLIGSFQEDQENRILKASHVDSELRFYLDDGSAVDLFYSSAGTAPGVVVEYEQGEIVLTSDFNDDGLDDLLVVEEEEFGDVVTCWARIMDNQLEKAFSGTFPYRTVSGLDFFDWDSDGVKELVVAFENTNNLFIYDINNGSLRYSREFTLPFEPSTLVPTEVSSPFQTSYLHVGNDTLDRHVLFNSRYPGVYSYITPLTFLSSVIVELDIVESDGSACQFIAVEYQDRLVVLRRENDNYETVCSLGLENSQPTASIYENGDSGNMKIILGF